MKIIVSGRIQTGNYTDKETGKKVYTTDVVVEEHEFCESKKDSGAPSNPANDEEFMTVPDGQESLLPF
jgi:single-strand DNA-binding protein